jgi:hypothetical protein
MHLKDWNEWTEEDRRGVGDGCITFYDPDADVGLGRVPIEPGVSIPRVGERVWLPATGAQGADSYGVTEVRYLYAEVSPPKHPAHARQLGIEIRVQRL